MPDTLHALIAARLDGLDTADRAAWSRTRPSLGQSFTIDAAGGGRRPRSRGGDDAARPPRPGRPPAARGRPAVTRAGAVRVRPGAHPGGRLLDAVAARPAQPPPRGRALLRVDRRRRARRRPRRPLSRRLPRVHRGSRGRGARRPGADRAPRRGRACDRARRARPGRHVPRPAIEVTTPSADRAELHERAGAARLECGHAGGRARPLRGGARPLRGAGRPAEPRPGWSPAKATRSARSGAATRRWRGSIAAGVEFARPRRRRSRPDRDSGARSRASPAPRATTREPREMADLVLELAERHGAAGRWPRMPARRWARRRSTAVASGRLARSSRGRAELAEEAALTELAFRAPRDAALDHRARRPARRRSRPERDGIALARRAGPPDQRDQHPLQRGRGRAADRRVGLGDLGARGHRDSSTSTSPSLVGDRAQQVFFEVYRGTLRRGRAARAAPPDRGARGPRRRTPG